MQQNVLLNTAIHTLSKPIIINYIEFFTTLLPTFRRRDKIQHYKIQNNGECFSLYGNDGFASVPELIDYYRSHDGEFSDENGVNIDLIKPLIVETSAFPLQQERYIVICKIFVLM